MTTPAQQQANRVNAQLSTGPRTPEGKALVSQNAHTHGLLSQEVLLPDEDGAALEALSTRLHTHFAPASVLEALVVDRVIVQTWRLRRAVAVETSLMTWLLARGLLSQEAGLVDVLTCDYGAYLERIQRYETAIERSLYKAMAELERLQAARSEAPGSARSVVVVESNGFVS